ncbi:putative protein kinase RLK-Pelle-CrRLK1L-1 family [Helianthus annuus]|nr:putative protein kinase RLK-Pelle-CrRLK1L-1 family [Helianthus annuus]
MYLGLIHTIPTSFLILLPVTLFSNLNQVNNLEHLKIPLTHILSATNDFSIAYRITIVDDVQFYRAELEHYDKENHSSKRQNTVIIKRYPSDRCHKYSGEKQFLTEIEILSGGVKHPNIVTLLGFCVEASEMILVLDNFSNGFLGEYLGNLKDKRLLTWEKRLKICIDVAHGFHYIHSQMEDQKMIINRDICSYNIGLDENFGAKIVYFGDSVILPPDQKDEALYLKWTLTGRKYHTDPEYKKTNKVKRESDVYGFGVVLFEILCGRLANDPIYKTQSDIGLAHVARQSFNTGSLDEMIDPIIKEETAENTFVLNSGPNKDSLHTFISIARQCVVETQDQRPTMKVVVNELEKALFFQKINKDNPKMLLEDIKQATQNFNNDNCIGGGGFGRVYKGNLQDSDGFKTIVAKRLDSRFGQGEQQFLSELQILLDFKHESIIGLVGFCDENDEKIIIYEYASKGSLDRYLNDVSLTWEKRLDICIDVAKALHFLHGGVGKQAKVIHRDIKTANILLDDDWKAKLADFGLSLVSPLVKETDYVIDHVCGTTGYLDPLYRKSGFLTIESDIYSFGVVLFEILCGRSTFEIQKHEGRYLPEFIEKSFKEGKHGEVVFEQIREQIVPESLITFQEAAYQCLHLDREKRPTTKKVLMQLKKALVFQERKFEHLKIRLGDIKLATNNFSKTYTIASMDGECTLYRAELHCFDKENSSSEKGKNKGDHPKGHNIVVIKRYPSGNECFQEEEFFTEIEMLSSVEHPNIVTLIGFCIEDSEMILVIENVSNGYLRNHLGNNNNMCILTWEKRLKICIDVANALEHLHSEMEDQKMIIHRDICSYTIGLDENWRAKIDGFGDCVFLPPNQEEKAVYIKWRGRSHYIDPEYEKTRKLKRESDVYSFGIVLLEILCGRTAFDPIYLKESDKGLGPVARQNFCIGILEDMIDPILKEETSECNFVLKRGPNKESLHTFMKIAYQCVAETQDQRPTMKVVVEELEKALLFQLNSEVKSDYVEEKSHASIIETQVVEISNELNNMNMTGKSENFEIHNKENMLHDQTDDPAEPDCCKKVRLLGRLLHLLGQIC